LLRVADRPHERLRSVFDLEERTPFGGGSSSGLRATTAAVSDSNSAGYFASVKA
jgi:hypothetical protein